MTVSFVAVMPAIDLDLATLCLDSMHHDLRDQLLLIDNTETGEVAVRYRGDVMFTVTKRRNIGVPRAWNEGVALAQAMGVDYLLIVSQALLFGQPGGRDVLDELERRRPEWIMHGLPGWKCIALNMRLFAEVGTFDPVFSPAYYEDTDFLYRMGLAGLPSPRENGGELDQIHIDAQVAGDGLMLRRGIVKLDYRAHAALYASKWGGAQGDETYTHPYDDPTLDWRFVGEYARRARV